MPSSVVWFVLPKGKYKIREEEIYEEKSIMYGISSDHAANNNGIALITGVVLMNVHGITAISIIQKNLS